MSRRRLFGTLCGMVLVVNLARFVYAPLVEPLAAAFGVPAEAIAPAASATWLGSALPRVPTGWLLTRVSRVRVIAGAGAVLTAASLLAAGASSVPTLVGGGFLLGLSSGVYFIAANPLVSELFPDTIGQAVGAHGTAAQLGAVVAPGAVTAVLVVAGWQSVFVLLAGAAALATAAMVLASRGTDLPEAGHDDRDLLAALRAQWPIVLTGVAVVGATGFVWNGVFNLYVTFLKTKGLSGATGNLLLTVMFAAGIPAFLVSGRLTDRLPTVPYLLSILGGTVGTLLGLTVLEGTLALAVGTAAFGYVVHSLFPAIDTYLLGTMPDRHRASAYSVYSGSMMVIQAGGAASLGWLVSRGVAYETAFRGFAGVLALVLAALVVLYAAGRLPRGRTAADPDGRREARP